MLSIRLARFGKKKQPSYRIIVCQKHKDALGDYIAKIGHINYFGGKKNVELDVEAAKHWISVGAQPTKTVHNLLITEGIITEKKVRPKGVKRKVEEAEGGEASEAAPASEDKPAEEKTEEPKEEAKEEAPAEEKKEERKE